MYSLHRFAVLLRPCGVHSRPGRARQVIASARALCEVYAAPLENIRYRIPSPVPPASHSRINIVAARRPEGYGAAARSLGLLAAGSDGTLPRRTTRPYGV